MLSFCADFYVCWLCSAQHTLFRIELERQTTFLPQNRITHSLLCAQRTNRQTLSIVIGKHWKHTSQKRIHQQSSLSHFRIWPPNFPTVSYAGSPTTERLSTVRSRGTFGWKHAICDIKGNILSAFTAAPPSGVVMELTYGTVTQKTVDRLFKRFHVKIKIWLRRSLVPLFRFVAVILQQCYGRPSTIQAA
jgi:hypothetical protein